MLLVRPKKVGDQDLRVYYPPVRETLLALRALMTAFYTGH